MNEENKQKENRDDSSYTVEKPGGKKFSEMESRFFTDYFRTNREITKNDRKRWQEEKEKRKRDGKGDKEPWTGRELLMLTGCVLLAILCILKYFVWKA